MPQDSRGVRPHQCGVRSIMSQASRDALTRLAPELLAGEARSLDQCFELGPHDGRVDTAMERTLREPAVGPGDDVLAAENAREPHDPLGYELRMLHHVGGVTDDAGDEQPAL